MDKTIAVIGTGAAGLTATAHLAREGFSVIAFDQGHIGGLLNPFERDGYEFDPGVHYVGRCAPGESTARELERLDLDPEELFAPMDLDFDHFRLGDFEIAMCGNADVYRARLHDAFAGDPKGVDRVMDAIGHVSAAMALQDSGRKSLRDYFEAAGALGLVRWRNATFGEYLDWACEDDLLKSVFAASCGDYGVPPSRSSAMMGLALLTHYITGAYFPRGGAGALRDALRNVGGQNGATFHDHCAIASVETKHGRVCAVTTEQGERFDVDGVVAAVDPRHVYGSMLPSDVVPDKIARRLPEIESSMSACVLYLGLNHDLREAGWGAFNIWDYPSQDIEAAYRVFETGNFFDEELFMFVSPNSLKDPTGSMAPEGCSTVEVLTAGPWKMFEPWEDVPAAERGEEFESLVSQVKQKIMTELEVRYPELVSGVEVCELSTPLAFRNHVRAIDGGLYGPAHTPNQVMSDRFAPSSGVAGLVLAGQGVFGCGVATAILSGRVASSILRKQLSE